MFFNLVVYSLKSNSKKNVVKLAGLVCGRLNAKFRSLDFILYRGTGEL